MNIVSVFKYAIGYAIWLTGWSFSILLSTKFFDSGLNGLLGIAICFLIYFYLNWSLSKLSSEETTMQILILSGVMIAILGCSLSTTTMWLYNDFLGQHNKLINSIRAVAVHGILGLTMSFYISGKLMGSKT